MARNRPINADVPATTPSSEAPDAEGSKNAPAVEAPEHPSPAAQPAPKAKAPAGKRRRKPVPVALKAVVGLVVVAVVFLVAAVLGGGGSNEPSEKSTPAPVHTPTKPAPEEPTPTAEAAEELGYPSFATNNTTRVGGDDPATTAAGVALAVFPAVKAAQRPTAVTLVDEDAWQGAVAAAVLMAEPLRAPLLVSVDGDLPEPTEQALAALAPQGGNQSNGAQAFTVGDAAAPDGLKATAVGGGNPAALAASMAKLRDNLFGGPPAHVVLAPEAAPEFAAPAAAWAARSADPVLFTAAEKLPPATTRTLKRYPKLPVFVLGPSAAIGSSVVREVAKLGNPVRRVSGEDPVESSIALARYSDGEFGWNVNDPGHGLVVARSDDPIRAAVAAPLSASGTWGPLLLSDDAGTLPAALRDYLLDIKPGYTTDPTRAFYNHVWVIGDQEAIDVNQQAEIDQLAELAKIGAGEP